MSGKGKFLYITNGGERKIKIADSAFAYDVDNTEVFNLKDFSTADLLKVKAQLATELSNRMDYDDVVESNIEKLLSVVRQADGKTLAMLARQTMDRLDQVGDDEKRAKTRLTILQDEIKRRMDEDGESKIEYRGLINAVYEQKTVYSVGEKGWPAVYSQIVADCLKAQFANQDGKYFAPQEVIDLVSKGLVNIDSFNALQKRLNTKTIDALAKESGSVPEWADTTTIRSVKFTKNKK